MKLPGDGQLLSALARRVRSQPVLAASVAVAITLIAIAVRSALSGQLEKAPFITLFPAVVVATFFCGTLGGVISMVVGGLLSWWLFLTPTGSFALVADTPLLLVSFLMTSGLMVLVVTALNRVVDALHEQKHAVETLFLELQHRVANNLSFVAALLRLQRRSVEVGAAQALDNAASRIAAMGEIHRMLYVPRALDRPLADHLRELCLSQLSSAGAPAVAVTVHSEIDRLELKATLALSMILNEILTNAAKHAFPAGSEGSFSVRLERRGGRIVMSTADSGPGLPDGFEPRQSKRLGFLIIQNLANSLGGEARFLPGRGAGVEIEFAPADAERHDPG